MRCAGAVLLALFAAPVLAQNGDRAGEEQPGLPPDLEVPAAPALSPEDELGTLRVHAGHRVELFAAEPLVVDPVQIAFDELGRLWVVEMRGYMPDAEGNGEKEPIGVIAILEDTDGDGRADERTEFASDLVLPRGVLPFEGGAVCILPPEIVFLRDDDGDGAFDVREVIDTGVRAALDNPEHDVNAPTLGLDNWIHVANWKKSYRRVVGDDGEPGWTTRREAAGGQWGLSVDEVGRLYRNTNPNPLHVDVLPPHHARRNGHQRRFRGTFERVGAQYDTYPARINPGVNRGYQPSTLRDDFTLARFTGACSPLVHTGDGLGPDGRGDAFVCEPAGNLVKRYAMTEAYGACAPRADQVVAGGLDFLTSTDERFRPVTLATGPDGALYVGDMYRGIVQHRIFMTTFLRKQVDGRGLATPLGQGRVWRVVRDGAEGRAPDVDLFELEPADVVPYLASDNTWLRRTAQRLLIEWFDGEASVVEALRALARDGTRPLGAMHALWTLEGIGFLDDDTVAVALVLEDPRVRTAAAAAAEGLVTQEGSRAFELLAGTARIDRSERVRAHAMLSVGTDPRPAKLDVFAERMTRSAGSAYERSAVVAGLQFQEASFLARLASRPEWSTERKGRAALLTELAACVGREGIASNVEDVVDLALRAPERWWSDALLAGLESTRRKGPKGEHLPIPLPERPTALAALAAIDREEAAEVADRVAGCCTWPGKGDGTAFEAPRELSPAELASYARGEAVFAKVCAQCHQPHGGGAAGFAPTLRGTKYVLGDEDRLARILLLGLEGPLEIEGEVWDLQMPKFEGTDAELSDVLTYVRRSWGNAADPIETGRIESVRAAVADRTKALHPSEL
ncbi:MAG: PVC-type heme-binding CxxCH protein [Planctomycetota bacterium]